VTRFFVGLGGNLDGDAAIVERFRRAREALGGVASSRLYRSAPIGPAQPDYLNAAIAIDTELAGAALIAWVLAIERGCGREREGEVRWGPRAIDLDILDGDVAIQLPSIVVPHPRLHERAFALAPLADLDPKYLPALERVRGQRCDVARDTW
jgi:2-amino-4-hydroxy-6-hydroxymethyldihydropteridine diphosphokinase